MVPPLRYKGKFITQKKYEQKMRMLEHMANMRRIQKEKREARKREADESEVKTRPSPRPSKRPPTPREAAESEVKTRPSPRPSKRPATPRATPSPSPSPPVPRAKKENAAKPEVTKKRGIKRKASPDDVSGGLTKRRAVDKQNLENSPHHANVSSGSAKSDK